MTPTIIAWRKGELQDLWRGSGMEDEDEEERGVELKEMSTNSDNDMDDKDIDDFDNDENNENMV